MLEEENFLDQIIIDNNNHILLRYIKIIKKNGVEISRNYHRISYYPGQDLSEAPSTVLNVASVVWTAEIISQYNELKNGTI